MVVIDKCKHVTLSSKSLIRIFSNRPVRKETLNIYKERVEEVVEVVWVSGIGHRDMYIYIYMHIRHILTLVT